jgi:uncharacterized protein (UPF0216 family)
LHEFYIEKIRHYSRRLVEVEDLNIEDYEERILQVQRNLMQGDYADLYLQNALNGVEIVELLAANKNGQEVIKKVNQLLEQNKKATTEIYKLLDPIIEKALNPQSDFDEKMAKFLAIMLNQAKWRGTRLPIYNVLIHSIEFEEENKKLQLRHSEMTGEIKSLLKLADKKFSRQDAEELRISYEMANNFARYKDVMGAIDDGLLPLWLGLLGRVHVILRRTNEIYFSLNNSDQAEVGPGSIFYALGWFLPDELKVKVYSPDCRAFSLKNL